MFFRFPQGAYIHQGGCYVSIKTFSSLQSSFFKNNPVQLDAETAEDLLCMFLILTPHPHPTPCSFFKKYYFYLFLFPLCFFSPWNVFSACSCLGCRHGGQKLWHCVVWMPYFHSTACLELWFVRSLACRGTSSSLFWSHCTKTQTGMRGEGTRKG